MKRLMIYAILILILLAAGWQGSLFWQALGHRPTGERLTRCQQSAQWRNGHFENTLPTPQLTGNDGFVMQMWKFLFGKYDNLKPAAPVAVVKTDLKSLPRSAEVCVWLGHSSIYLQTGGVRFLFDPVLTNDLPVWWFMRPFRGADAYRPADIPDVDYLVITHDHWDHLDWRTVKALKPRVRHVVCSLGIGEHFEYWGYDAAVIHDMDWGDTLRIDAPADADNGHASRAAEPATLHCLPSRHFSGRMGGSPQTLWASYLIDGPRRIFVSGDGGYDERFRQIGHDFRGIDLAIMENGQYDDGWKYIHTMPSELPVAIDELGASRVLTYHHGKYALANHAWTAPLDSIWANAQGKPWQLLTPRIGEPIHLDRQQTFTKWW